MISFTQLKTLIAQSLAEVGTDIINWVVSELPLVIIVFIVTFVLNKTLKKVIIKTVQIAVVRGKYLTAEAEKQRETTLIRIFGLAAKIGIWSTFTLFLLQEVGIPIATLLTGAGILGLALGFGGQYLIKDIISGIFIIFENQYRIGDVVKIAGVSGAVEDISLRMTTLRDLDGVVHHVPHGSITDVSNLSKDFSRVNLDIGVGYSTNIEHLIRVINEVGEELATDPAWKSFINEAPKFLRINDFGDSAIIVKILGSTIPLKNWDVTGELRKRIKIRFDKEGIEIPFPQRVIHQA